MANGHSTPRPALGEGAVSRHLARQSWIGQAYALMVLLAFSNGALAQTAIRDLPQTTIIPGQTSLTVTIMVTVPGGTAAVGVEDAPPGGWIVSNISAGGTFDSPQNKVKWGPIFNPTSPIVLTYDVFAPGSAGGVGCFIGSASFDLQNQPITGDACLQSIPTLSHWGLAALTGCLLVSATLAISRRRQANYPLA